jgi:LysM repeat protein
MQSEFMIESEPDLPVEPGERAMAWSRVRDAMRQGLTRVGQGTGAWLSSLAAGQPGSVRPAVGGEGTASRLRERSAQFSRWTRSLAGDLPLIDRLALHFVIVLLAVGVVVVTQVRIPEIKVWLPPAALSPELEGDTDAEPPPNRGGGRVVQNDVALLAAPVVHTIIPERARTEVITYTVQPNDNMWVIAQNLGLQVESLLWANPDVEKSPDLLSVGQILIVPPVDGVYYTVQKGDTLAKVAKKFKTSVDKIVGFVGNGLEPASELAAGQKIMLPDGKKPVPPSVPIYPMTRVGSAPKGAPQGSGRFAWPTQGLLTQRYWSGHPGIDIANRIGTPILAADAGYVVMAGRDTWGYGNQVVIDHGNGYWTRYAHLDRILVTAGDIVKKNQKIGTMGNTGRSTGSHLHFEVILNRTQRNPMSYLP